MLLVEERQGTGGPAPLTVASGMSGLANGTFHSPNQAQRIWFDGCIVLGSILLLPVFAGVAAAGAVGGGLVVAGAIGVMILDIYGE
jgi:hypothetical protein